MWYRKLIDFLLYKVVADKDAAMNFYSVFFEVLNKAVFENKNFADEALLEVKLGLVDKIYTKFAHQKDVSLKVFAEYLVGLTLVSLKIGIEEGFWDSDLLPLFDHDVFVSELQLGKELWNKELALLAIINQTSLQPQNDLILLGMLNIRAGILKRFEVAVLEDLQYRLSINLDSNHIARFLSIFSRPQSQDIFCTFLTDSLENLGRDGDFDIFIRIVYNFFKFQFEIPIKLTVQERIFQGILKNIKEETSHYELLKSIELMEMAFFIQLHDKNFRNYEKFKDFCREEIKKVGEYSEAEKYQQDFERLDFLVRSLEVNYSEPLNEIGKINFYAQLKRFENENENFEMLLLNLHRYAIDYLKNKDRNLANYQIFKGDCIGEIEAAEKKCSEGGVLGQLHFAVLGLGLPFSILSDKNAADKDCESIKMEYALVKKIKSLPSTNDQDTITLKLLAINLNVITHVYLYNRCASNNKILRALFKEIVQLHSTLIESLGCKFKEELSKLKKSIFAVDEPTFFSPHKSKLVPVQSDDSHITKFLSVTKL